MSKVVKYFSGFLAAGLLLSQVACDFGKQSMTTAQVETIVHEYLVKNPQVLMEAFQALRSKKMAEHQKQAKQMITSHAAKLLHSSSSPVMGNPQGEITVVEFLDYRCPHCRSMLPVIQKMMAQDENLRVVIKTYPIFAGLSNTAAQGVLAAGLQGKFAEFHDALLGEQQLTQAVIEGIAQSLKLDMAKWQTDMNSAEVQQEISEVTDLAKTLGIMGTPAMIVADASAKHSVFLPGEVSVEKLQSAVTEVRKLLAESSTPDKQSPQPQQEADSVVQRVS